VRGADRQVRAGRRPGIEAVREADSPVFVGRGHQSIASAYNSILDRAHDCEALLLIHDDVRFFDPDTCAKVLAAMSDVVAIVGVVGGVGSCSLGWWNGVIYGSAHDGDGLIGGTDGPGTYEVDSVDGLFLALSRWAIDNLRFDCRYRGFDGYDGDICAQARSAGKRVVVTQIHLHHDTPRGFRDGGTSFQRADWRWRAKWLPIGPIRKVLYRLRSYRPPSHQTWEPVAKRPR